MSRSRAEPPTATHAGHEREGLLRAIAGGEAERARAIVAEHIDTVEREIRTVP